MENSTFNLHIFSLCSYITRYVEEISKAQSAGVMALTGSDKERLLSYISQTRKYLTWIWDQQSDDSGDFLDLPESTPNERFLTLIDPVGEMENDALRDVVEHLKTFYTEAMNCQSSRLGAGLIIFDYDRFVDILNVLDSFVDTFITNGLPQDFPESSPRKLMPEVGKTGVKKK